ncbi:aromatic ring-opening dioxygenase catalytic subunit (LigB family) [Bradyrhizobium sp. USDA 4501]
MGDLAFAAALSHAPGIAAFTDKAPEQQRRDFLKAAARVGAELDASKPDAIVFIAPDHFTNFFVDRMPAFCVGMNEDYEGPVEKWLGIPKGRVPGAADFAAHLLEEAMESGFDPAFSRGLKLEHSVMVPMSLIRPQRDIPIVWIMVNCQVAPMPSLRRCYDFGKVLRKTIGLRSERIAVIATGGLSHAPGAAEASRLDPDFDRQFLALLASDKPTSVLDIPLSRLDQAGFGSWEIRPWAVALGATEGRPAQTLSYAPIEAWQTGCAVSVFS